MESDAIRDLLETKYRQYNTSAFIDRDPVSIPHSFTLKEDIEIAGLLTATISWGNRTSILKNANGLMERMDMRPFEFVMHHQKKDLRRLDNFVHRTFNGQDARFFISSLQNIYLRHGGLEQAFIPPLPVTDLSANIDVFRQRFLEPRHASRVEKHLSSPLKKSTAKRLCMFLRWMVRRDKLGVDFGIWTAIRPSQLMLPLDVHTGRVSRELGLLKRKQNDWQAVQEVTSALCQFDSSDPVKYDFALFGMGENGEL